MFEKKIQSMPLSENMLQSESELVVIHGFSESELVVIHHFSESELEAIHSFNLLLNPKLADNFYHFTFNKSTIFHISSYKTWEKYKITIDVHRKMKDRLYKSTRNLDRKSTFKL